MTPFSAFASQALMKAKDMADTDFDLDPREQKLREQGWAIDDVRKFLFDHISDTLCDLENAGLWRAHPSRYAQDRKETVSQAAEKALSFLLSQCDLPENLGAYVELPEQTP